MTTHSRPFLVDYQHQGRSFSVLMLGPADWTDAEAHVASLQATAQLIGSDVVEIPADKLAPMLDLWSGTADALLESYSKLGAAHEMALAGAAVLTASCIVAGLDRTAADACAGAMFDAAYASAEVKP